jgi:hypothetical protein
MRAGSCIHYRGSNAERLCNVGVDVRARFTPKWPCWTGNNPKDASAICDLYEEPTAEQLAQSERESNAAIERTFCAVIAVERWEKEQPGPPPLRGSILCPCCKEAKLEIYTTARHVYATCRSPNCVNFRGNRRR